MPILALSLFIIGFFIGCILLYFFQQWRKHRAIVCWRKHLRLQEHQPVFERLYENVDGFSLSKQARLNQDAIEYTYGEIEFESFIATIGLTQPNEQTIFYDLGSGTGKAVIAMSMVFNVEKSSGIELFLPLHEAAITQKNRLLEQGDYHPAAKKIEFIHDNLLGQTYPDATLIYIQASVFIGESWINISQHLEHLTPGTLVISTTKALESLQFTVIYQTLTALSFGVVEVFIQQRNQQTSSEAV